MNDKPSDLSSIRLETLIALLRSQPQDIAMNFYNETKELERKIDFNQWSNPTEEYRFEIANKIFQEFNIFDDNKPAVSFSSSFDEKCNWYKKFFGSSNECVQHNSGQSEIWNLGDRGIDLKLAYLSKKDACEGVKFMFEQSPDGEQAKYPSWYSSEEIAEANKNAFPISPRWLEIVIASIDWNIPLECGDAELELLLKE